MADGVTWPPTGVGFATDDCGADGQVEVVKLAVATDGSAAKIPADATNGLAVNDTKRIAGTATLSNVNDTASSVSLLASNANRKGVLLFNDSTALLYLKYGATASATSHSVQIAAGGYWEMPQPVYTGAIDGIWASDQSGAARITELT